MWEPRKGKSRHLDRHQLSGQVRDEGGDSVGGIKSDGPTSGQNDGNSTDESTDSNKSHSRNSFRKRLRKIGSVFHRSPKDEDKPNSPREPEPSPHDNIKALNAKKVGVRLIIDDTIVSPSLKTPKDDDKELLDETAPESLNQGRVKDVAKGILKQAGKSARGLKLTLSRKASRKSKAEDTLPTDKDSFLESDSSDDESLSLPSDAGLAETGLVIPGSAVSTPESLPANNSFKSKDSIVQTANLSGNNSFKTTDNAVPTGATSGNNSFKSEDNAIETPKSTIGSNMEQATQFPSSQ